jgi:hypothetical protein
VQGLLQQGFDQILNLQPAAGGTASNAPGTPPPTAAAKNNPAPTTTTTTTPPTTTTTTCGLLSQLLGCPKSSSGSGSGSGSNASQNPLGGLLSNQVHPSGAPTAQLARATATASTAAPTLTAPAAALLPPLPGGAQAGRSHRHAAHRGFLSSVWHDLTGWM